MTTTRWIGAALGFAIGMTCAAAHAASFSCVHPGSPMTQMVCADPALGARDDALARLFAFALGSPDGAAVRAAQRRWLSAAQACRSRDCLSDAYDRRLGDLLQADDGRGIARRFHMELDGLSGDLLIVREGDWITYDVVQTAVGPKGEAAGDVAAARLTGSARLKGRVAVEQKATGCELILQINPGDEWSVGTRHCFRDDGANLNGLYRPTSR